MKSIWNWLKLNVSFDIRFKEEYPTLWVRIANLNFEINVYFGKPQDD
jgi:hypothetical protein